MSAEPDFTDIETIFESDPFSPTVVELHEKQRVVHDDDTSARHRAFLERRKNAYVNVFSTGKSSEDERRLVLADMTRFCRGGVTTYNDNDRIHALLTGRQEWYLRVQEHLTLTLDELVLRFELQPAKG